MALVAQLRSLSLPASAGEISSLDVSREALGELDDVGGEIDLLTNLRSIVLDLCSSDGPIPAMVTSNEGLDGRSPYWDLFRKAATAYSRLCVSATKHDVQGFLAWRQSDAFVQVSYADQALADAEELDRANEALSPEDASGSELVRLADLRLKAVTSWNQSQAALALNVFDAALLWMTINDLVSRDEVENTALATLQSDPQTETFGILALLAKEASPLGGSLQALMLEQLTDLLDYASHIAEGQAEWKAKASVDGAFSDAWLAELASLARRDSRLGTKYGVKQIEKRLERHLVLLFQTFGFGTVPALSGEAAADLLCIGRADPQRYSFLVDAKSSGRPYALPKKDQRAIEDYADETRRSLGDLPRLSFLLIVGHGPAGTVSAKIESLESRIGLPVRFIEAAKLVDLRRQVPGALRADVFLKAMLESDPVVSDDYLDKLIAKNSEPDEAITTLVRSLRKAAKR